MARMTNTAEVVLEGNRGGRERRNVIHYQYPNGTAISIAQLEQLAQECFDNIVNSQQAVTCTGTSWQRASATDVGPLLGGFTASISGFRTGTFNAPAAPGNVSFVLSKRTGVKGPRHRGRFYLFDLPEGGITDDTIDLGLLPLMTNLAGELQFTRVGGLFVPAVGSREGVYSTPIQSMTFDLTTDSQRRRLTGRGR